MEEGSCRILFVLHSRRRILIGQARIRQYLAMERPTLEFQWERQSWLLPMEKTKYVAKWRSIFVPSSGYFPRNRVCVLACQDGHKSRPRSVSGPKSSLTDGFSGSVRRIDSMSAAPTNCRSCTSFTEYVTFPSGSWIVRAPSTH